MSHPHRWPRAALVVLALTGLQIGLWGVISPTSFYRSYPGFGLNWLADGAYDEHLLRDIAAFALALGVLAAWAALTDRRDLIAAAGVSWLIWSTPHALFHIGERAADGLLPGVAAAGLPLLALVTLVGLRRASVVH